HTTRVKTLVPRKRKQACLTMLSTTSTSYSKNKKTKTSDFKKENSSGPEEVNKVTKQEDADNLNNFSAEDSQKKEEAMNIIAEITKSQEAEPAKLTKENANTVSSLDNMYQSLNKQKKQTTHEEATREEATCEEVTCEEATREEVKTNHVTNQSESQKN